MAPLSVPVFQTTGTVRVETRKDVWICQQLLAQRTCRYFVRLFHRGDRHVPNTRKENAETISYSLGELTARPQTL